MVWKVVRMTIQVTILQDPNEKHFDYVGILSKYEVNDNNNLCSALSRIVAFHRHSVLTIITPHNCDLNKAVFLLRVFHKYDTRT